MRCSSSRSRAIKVRPETRRVLICYGRRRANRAVLGANLRFWFSCTRSICMARAEHLSMCRLRPVFICLRGMRGVLMSALVLDPLKALKMRLWLPFQSYFERPFALLEFWEQLRPVSVPPPHAPPTVSKQKLL